MTHTQNEIFNQPAAWAATVRSIPDQWREIATAIASETPTHVLLVGCGTSFYLAQAAAQSFQEVTGMTATAAPGSEVFLSPASVVPRDRRVLAFLISRSGETSEVLRASAFLRDQAQVTTICVTCNERSALVGRCDYALTLPQATEQSMVMTQSFTSMLLALQLVAALIAEDQRFLEELAQLPDAAAALLPEADRFATTVAERPGLDQVIFLGLGPNYGVAAEGNLKLKEMTQTPSEVYNPLEFRHGPISVVTAGTTIVLIEGERERDYLPGLVDDLRAVGATVAEIGPGETTTADALGLGRSRSDLARCCLATVPLQLIGLRRAGYLGVDPDRPRNLNPVVVLSEPV